eukprot:scaffold9517_cov117-Isochrysis_galbana.AAC.9
MAPWHRMWFRCKSTYRSRPVVATTSAMAEAAPLPKPLARTSSCEIEPQRRRGCAETQRQGRPERKRLRVGIELQFGADASAAVAARVSVRCRGAGPVRASACQHRFGAVVAESHVGEAEMIDGLQSSQCLRQPRRRSRRQWNVLDVHVANATRRAQSLCEAESLGFILSPAGRGSASVWRGVLWHAPTGVEDIWDRYSCLGGLQQRLTSPRCAQNP